MTSENMPPEERRAVLAIEEWAKAGSLQDVILLQQIIADAIREAVAAARREEREACAKIADTHQKFCRDEGQAGGSHAFHYGARGAAQIAAAIRAREEG